MQRNVVVVGRTEDGAGGGNADCDARLGATSRGYHHRLRRVWVQERRDVSGAHSVDGLHHTTHTMHTAIGQA